MIKVIDGVRYNTGVSELIFNQWNRKSTSDFHFRTKALYRTKSGVWFFHHDGGALSDTGGSENLEPISETDARRFLEKHSGESEALEALERFFGDSIRDA